MDRAILRTLACAAAVAALVLWAAVLIAAGQPRAAPVFTTEQATAGKGAYAKSCASCHMPDLSGSNEMPPLAGTAFVETWRARSTKELFDYLSASMPYGAPSLTTDTYVSITAYILQSNGAVSGSQVLSASTDVPIADLIPAP